MSYPEPYVYRKYDCNYNRLWQIPWSEFLILLHWICPKLYHKIPVPQWYQPLEYLQPGVIIKYYHCNQLEIIKVLSRTLDEIYCQNLICRSNTPEFSILAVDRIIAYQIYKECLTIGGIITEEEAIELILAN